MELSPVFKEIESLEFNTKQNKGNGDLRARPHAAKLLTCDEGIKENLKETTENRKLDKRPKLQPH